MIIAVDFDGTLEQNGQPNRALIKRLRYEQQRGASVILWTCRHGERLTEALSFLAKNGLKPNFVNANHPATIAKNGDSRKILADVYIDDKAWRY